MLSLGPSDTITGSQFLPSFASSVLRSLAFSCEDQSILISGHQTSDKSKLCYDFLSTLLYQLEQKPSTLASSFLVAVELLNILCSSDEYGCGRAVVVYTVIANPSTLGLVAGRMCALLLDTSTISCYKVCFKLCQFQVALFLIIY